MNSILLCLGAYLLGGIPSGRVIANFYNIDVRSTGSGNTGATNVARTAGKIPGLLTLLADVTKGVLAVLLSSWLSVIELAPLSGLLAVCGHCFPLPNLRGGKGVATALGVLLVLSWEAAVASLLTFAIVFFWKRIVSLSSIAAASIGGLYIVLLHSGTGLSAAVAAIALLILLRHHENIRRLVKREEKVFSFKQ